MNREPCYRDSVFFFRRPDIGSGEGQEHVEAAKASLRDLHGPRDAIDVRCVENHGHVLKGSAAGFMRKSPQNPPKKLRSSGP